MKRPARSRRMRSTGLAGMERVAVRSLVTKAGAAKDEMAVDTQVANAPDGTKRKNWFSLRPETTVHAGGYVNAMAASLIKDRRIEAIGGAGR